MLVLFRLIQDLEAVPTACSHSEAKDLEVATPHKALKLQDFSLGTFSPKLEFDDSYMDDDLDPAMKEELDR